MGILPCELSRVCLTVYTLRDTTEPRCAEMKFSTPHNVT